LEDVERKFVTNIRLNVRNQNCNVLLKGIFDRVDKIGNTIRIIDYKTGKVNQWDLNLRDWENLIDDAKFDKCFQLLFYSYIYWKSNDTDIFNVTPGIISFRNLKQGLLSIGLPKKENFSQDTILQFENILKAILLDMLDAEVAYSQTSEEENCKYCTFKSICNRN